MDLLESEGYTTIVVITNRLSKGVITGGLPELIVEVLTKWFLYTYYSYYFLPIAIVSNRGS